MAFTTYYKLRSSKTKQFDTLKNDIYSQFFLKNLKLKLLDVLK